MATDVPADEIAAHAGVTRGALYHHYADKKELFREVFEQLETEITNEIATAANRAPDLLAALTVALSSFLDVCERPEVVRIALTDAPAVLGWQTWREIEERHGLGLIIAMLHDATDAGQLVPADVAVLARLVMSALIEGALVVAHADDQAQARAGVEQALLTLLTGLVTPPERRS